METSKAGSLEDAIANVDRLIAFARSQGFGDSVQFLAMARTQLLIDIHGITDSEFRAFCDWLDGKQPPPKNRRGAEPGRVRRDGHLRGMRRAWLCPQEAAALRRSLRRGARTGR
jgi:hypothetical protein